MLVLSRRVDESLTIGDDIVVTVFEIRSNGQVRLGIEAPSDVPVWRKEIHEAIQREKHDV